MKYFGSVDELYFDACQDVLRGSKLMSRNGDSYEVIGYSARLLGISKNFVFNPLRNLDPAYAAAELLWYLSNTNDIELVKAYAPQYAKFTEDGKHAWGAYGYRWKSDPSFCLEFLKSNIGMRANLECDSNPFPNYSQIQLVSSLLKNDPNTRQAIVSMWNGGDLVHAVEKDKLDLPCTLSLNFLLRNGKLNLIATMRSNDIWFGMPYDIWCFTCLQKLVAESIGVECGWYQHQVGSLHVYEVHYDRVKGIWDSTPFQLGQVKVDPNLRLEYTPHCNKISECINLSLQWEREVRETKQRGIPLANIGIDSLLSQVHLMAATKWIDEIPAALNEPMYGYIARRKQCL